MNLKLFVAWFFASIFLSTSFIFQSKISDYSVSVEYASAIRLLIASVFLFILAIATRTRIKISKAEIRDTAIVCIFSQLYLIAITYSSGLMVSGLASCVTLTQIFISEAMMAGLERRKVNNRAMLSGLLGLIGIGLLCNQQFNGLGNSGMKTIIGVVASVIAVVVASVSNILFARSKSLEKTPKITFVFYSCLIGAVFVFLLGRIIHPSESIVNSAFNDLKYWGILIYLAITTSALFLLALYYIIAKQGPVKITYINFILPVLTMLISTIFEGYKWNLLSVAGMVILLYSVWVGIKPAKNNN